MFDSARMSRAFVAAVRRDTVAFLLRATAAASSWQDPIHICAKTMAAVDEAEAWQTAEDAAKAAGREYVTPLKARAIAEHREWLADREYTARQRDAAAWRLSRSGGPVRVTEMMTEASGITPEMVRSGAVTNARWST